MGKETFHTVYDTFYRKSFLFVKSYVGESTVAEDIATESLIKIWEKLKTDESLQIAPFLFSMLKNSALDHLRREKRKLSALTNIKAYTHRDLEIRLSTLQASDPDEIFSAEVVRIIHETLAALPEKTRLIFEMSRFEGKPYKEIARQFEISVKGVEYHISQALSILRISLKDYLPVWFFFLRHF